MTITEVRGFGRQKGHTEVYRGAGYNVDFVPKIKVEVVIHDSQLSVVVGIIAEVAKTGQVGDGKIFVSTLDEVVRIRDLARRATVQFRTRKRRGPNVLRNNRKMACVKTAALIVLLSTSGLVLGAATGISPRSGRSGGCRDNAD